MQRGPVAMSSRSPKAITEEWIRENTIADPEDAVSAWRAWLAKHPRSGTEAQYWGALQVAADVSAATVQLYREGQAHRLGERMWWILEEMTLSLGRSPPEIREHGRKNDVNSLLQRSRRRNRRIAVLTHLVDIPSPSFHVAVLRSVITEAERRHLEVAIHEMPPGDMEHSFRMVVKHFDPRGLVLIRLNPTERELAPVARRRVPAVLIHSDLASPPPPVIANIVPGAEALTGLIAGWAQDRLVPGAGEVVIAAMAPEGRIRQERIARIQQGLARFDPVLCRVSDYSFRHALEVHQAHPHAQAYVCLSDELAVGVKHLSAGTRRAAPPHIVGFDDSRLAEQEKISSFSQGLEKVGKCVVDRLAAWFGSAAGEEQAWPAAEEARVDVSLAIRG